MKMAENEELKDVLFKWFLQQQAVVNPLSGPIVSEEAKRIAQQILYCIVQKIL